MSKLTSAERDALPSSDFAIPSQRKYPIEDEGHRQAALGRVAEFGSPSQQATVKKKVGSFSRIGSNTQQ